MEVVQASGTQQELPFALVQGQPYLTLPQDLYIPPDALEVFLDTFEGPLDLLLYLIKRQNLDILHIPIAVITDQYMEYMELMTELRLELAAEYLVMAAMLAEIKSRMLLPRPTDETTDEGDPRAELIRRLMEYERFKQAAQDLDGLPRLERDHFVVHAEFPPGHLNRKPPEVDLREVLMALRGLLARADLFTSHRVEKESLSLRERMSLVLERVRGGRFLLFTELFDVTEGRAGVVVTFLALLELIRAATLELVQSEPFAPIHVRLREGQEQADGDEPDLALEAISRKEDPMSLGTGYPGMAELLSASTASATPASSTTRRSQVDKVSSKSPESAVETPEGPSPVGADRG